MFEIVLSPHNDDESLFMAYTIMRHKPLVVIVTDGYNQKRMGFEVTAEQRREETIEAMKILDAPYVFLGIKDIDLTEELLISRLKYLDPSTVYAPAIQGGHKDHDLVGKVAEKLFGMSSNYDRLIQYSTYSKDVHFIEKGDKVEPTAEEMKLKNEALDKYASQIKYSRPHFEAVRDKPEYIIC